MLTLTNPLTILFFASVLAGLGVAGQGPAAGLAVAIGLSSALGGLTASYHLATPPGPTIALATVVWFAGCAAAQACLRAIPA